MMDQDSIQKEFATVKERYPDLFLGKNSEGAWRIIGDLHFRGEFEGQEIVDKYSVEIQIPMSYPNELPLVKEVGGRIPKEFHTSYDGMLCLGTPLALKMRFYQDQSLIGFVENCLVEYLYGYSHKLKFGRLPFGEFSHGVPGIIQHYQELFAVKNIRFLLRLLDVLVKENYRGHNRCPCGSGEKLRKCHGNILLGIMKYQNPREFKRDQMLIGEFLKKPGENF